jgi:hypothetical protein
VRPKFLDMARSEGGSYPDAFPYRQRVVLLHQRVDGADVALFCMYVQEYGPHCPAPNRCVLFVCGAAALVGVAHCLLAWPPVAACWVCGARGVAA